MKPDRLDSFESSLVEGDNVKFICKGNVGRPPGKYLWQKVRTDLTTFLYENVATTVTEVLNQVSCATYNGTSNLTIQMTAEDNQAIVRCVEQSCNGSEQMYAQSTPVHVLYKVRKTRITKHPNQDFHQVGSDPIELICNADGNPQCTYTWYKTNNLTHILSQEQSLVISPVNYNNNHTVDIYIIAATPEQDTDLDSIRNTAIILSCVVMCFLCLVVVVLVYCKKKKNGALQSVDINMHYECTRARTVHVYDDIYVTTNENLYDEIQE